MGIKDLLMGKGNLKYEHDRNCITFHKEAKILTGKLQKRGGKGSNFRCGGETKLLSGSSFYFGGAMIQLGFY